MRKLKMPMERGVRFSALALLAVLIPLPLTAAEPDWIGTYSLPFEYVPKDQNGALQPTHLFANVQYKPKLYGYYHYFIDPETLHVRVLITQDGPYASFKSACGELRFLNNAGAPLVVVSHAWGIAHQSTDSSADFAVPVEKWKTAATTQVRWGYCKDAAETGPYTLKVTIY